jgi:hypothetical protein
VSAGWTGMAQAASNATHATRKQYLMTATPSLKRRS